MDTTRQVEREPTTDDDLVGAAIRDAGYSPTATDGVSDELKREIAAEALNREAEVAHIDAVEGRDHTVRVRFTLPYGGTFTHSYGRPDTTLDTEETPLEALLDATGVSVDDLDQLPDAPVTAEWVDGEWRPDHEGISTTDESISRAEYARILLATRVVATPLCFLGAALMGMALYDPGNTIAGHILVALIAGACSVMGGVLATGVVSLFLYEEVIGDYIEGGADFDWVRDQR